jgi:Fe-S-cluster containining protein
MKRNKLNDQPVPKWLAAACNGCGKCCLDASYMRSLPASASDIKRWRKEGREDILDYVDFVGGRKYYLWVKEGVEMSRCPFVKKDRNKPTYHCTIHETRPEACRGYPLTAGQMVKLGCEIVGEIELVALKLSQAKS